MRMPLTARSSQSQALGMVQPKGRVTRPMRVAAAVVNASVATDDSDAAMRPCDDVARDPAHDRDDGQQDGEAQTIAGRLNHQQDGRKIR